MDKCCIIHEDKGELSVHDNVQVPFTEKSKVLSFLRILKFGFFSGTLTALILSDVGVMFSLLLFGFFWEGRRFCLFVCFV